MNMVPGRIATVLLLGSGELGKEVVIELQRYGAYVIAVDRYANAPAMHVADQSEVIDMTDPEQVKDVVEKYQPTHIVPEIEAIATEMLVALETRGCNVVPTARAVNITMDRRRIRYLAAEQLKLKTSRYQFASTFDQFKQSVEEVGFPCVVKPTMSSSGKGQSVVQTSQDIEDSWKIATEGGRVKTTEVIVEEFIDFDYEITLLTVKHINGITFCPPICHTQKDGDYRTSWQPAPMRKETLEQCKNIAETIVTELCGEDGLGLFGVELFIKDNQVYFSEVSPRPHDTGLVTLITQPLSEFALHVRAFLGLPVPEEIQCDIGASAAILAVGDSDKITYHNLDRALMVDDNVDVRIFGKPEVRGKRRVGVALARLSPTQSRIRALKRVISLAETVRDTITVKVGE